MPTFRREGRLVLRLLELLCLRLVAQTKSTVLPLYEQSIVGVR